MHLELSLLLNAVVSGLLLGGFYAAATVGVAISFGMLDIVNIAHPGFIILGSYAVWAVNAALGLDPILSGVLLLPAFYLLGAGVYRFYHAVFERHARESLRGLAFFFGLLFIVEVGLVLGFGVDYRYVQTDYAERSLDVGPVGLPLRLLLPCLVSLLLVGVLQGFLQQSFLGRAIKAVAQDELALRLVAISPSRIKRIAFAISIATTAITGALLIVIQPVEPSIGRDYIGRVFAICVLGGMGSLPGTLLAAMALGIAENVTATFYGPSWAPAVGFGLLLVALGIRPKGLRGR